MVLDRRLGRVRRNYLVCFNRFGVVRLSVYLGVLLDLLASEGPDIGFIL